MSELDITRLRAAIPALQRSVYLNSGTSGPLPECVTQHMCALLAREAEEGPATPEVYHAALAEIAAAKSGLATLLNARVDELALTQSATQCLNIVAAGYPWQPGDEVLITDQEHVSGLVPWYALARHRGVRVRLLPVDPDPDITVRTFAAAIGPATRLLAFSHVSYCTGIRLPAARLCQLACERGVLTAIDGAQAVGQIPVDVRALGCDFYALPGQKWLLGPDGTGAFYVRAESLERLQPPALGWASVSAYGWEGESYTPFASARRFETATVSTPLMGGLRKAVEFALENGLENLSARIDTLSTTLKERLAAIPGIQVLTPRRHRDSSGLVSLSVQGQDPEALAHRLWVEERILCRSIPKPHCLRFAVHAFNTEAELERVAATLERLARTA